jgi:hypothetical protein
VNVNVNVDVDVKERLTSTRVGLGDYSHRTGRIVHPPAHAGSRRAEGDRSYPLLQEARSSDHNLVEGGIGQVAVRHNFGMAAVDRIGPEEVDSPAEGDKLLAEEDNLDLGRVADILAGCIGRKGLT